MPNPRLERQIEFILEIDKLKHVLRQTVLLDKSRRENSAEHSWHLAIMAVLLQEHAGDQTDLTRVMKMLLVHDIVEIDAGDTYAYDEAGHLDKDAREQAAADRIFGLLPADQAAELRALWDEYEAQTTPDSHFALALDRLQPMLHNYHTAGFTWQAYNVSRPKVDRRAEPVVNASPELGRYITDLINNAVARGYLKP